MSFSFSKQQREELLKAVEDQVSLLNNEHLTESDYMPEPFLFGVEGTHRTAFIALLEQDIDLLLAALDAERRRKKGRGAPRKEAVRYFVRQVAGHIESGLGIKVTVTHSPRGKGGLLVKVVRTGLKAAGQKVPADPFRLLASAIGGTREVPSDAEKPVIVWQEGEPYFPCKDQFHRHRTLMDAELCKECAAELGEKWGTGKKRKFKVEMDIPERKKRRSVKRSPRKPV